MPDLITTRDLEIKPAQNLLSYSHTFSNPVWYYTQTNTPTYNNPDPFGGNNAVRVFNDQGQQYSKIGRTYSLTRGVTYTFSFYLLPFGSVNNISIVLYNASNTPYLNVVLSPSLIIGGSSSFEFRNLSQIVLPNGWRRLVMTFSTLVDITDIQVWPKYYNGNYGDNTSGIYTYGWQLETGSKCSEYIATTTGPVTLNGLTSTTDETHSILSDITINSTTNLLANSKTYNNGNYSSSLTIRVDNFTIGPFPGTFATKVTSTNAAYGGLTRTGVSYLARTIYTISAYVKRDNWDYLGLRCSGDSAGNGDILTYYNLTSATVTQLNTPRAGRTITSGIINIGNGWYRIYLTFQTGPNPAATTDICLTNSSGGHNFGTGAESFYLYGLQLEPGGFSGAYVETNGTTKIGNTGNMSTIGEVIDISPLPSPIVSLDFTVPILDSRITFGRSDAVACATRVNSRGLIETVAANIPRFDYDPVTLKCLGLLVETGSSNMYTYSQDFSNTNIWRAYGQGVSLGSFLAPDGSITAYKVMESNGTSGDFGFARFGAYGNLTGTYTGSCYVKRINNRYAYFWHDNGGGDGLTLELDFNTGSTRFTRNGSANYTNVSGGAVNAGNGWWRVYITSTIANSTGGQLRVYTSSIPWTSGNFGTPTYTGNNVDGLYVWGFQLEQNPIMSSYIPTTSTSLTRTPDYVDLYVSTNMAGTVYVETGGSQYGLIIGPIPVVVGYPGSYEFATVRTSSRVGSWNGVNEVNTTNNSVVANNGFRYAIAWNKNGSYTSLNGISDQTGEGNSIGFGSTTYLRMGVYTTRPHSTRYKKLHLYSSKLPLATINTITSNSQPIVGTTTVNKLSAEITDLIPGTHNLLFNSEFLGAAEGILPTNWDFNGHTFTRTGITMTIKPGTYQGYSGLFLRYYGTATGSNEHVLTNRNPSGGYVPGIPFIQTNFSVYMALISGTKHSSFMIQNISRSKTSSALSLSVNYPNLTSIVTRYSITHNNPISNTEFYATKLGLAGFAINDVIDFTIFISSPQYNYGSAPLAYTPTGVNELSYGKISSTLSETSEITDLLKQSTSSFDIYANLVKFYTSGRQLSKEYSYPTLSTGSREIIFNTDRQGTNEYSSEARTTFSTDPRAVTLDAYIRPTNLYTSDHATETFSMSHKSPTFTKDP